MRRELEEKPTRPSMKGSGVTAASAKEKDQGKEELQGVFVVRNGRATFAQIESGIMSSTDMEVLKGVQPGDTIVTGSFSVLRTLKNNTKVRVENTPAIPTQSTSGRIELGSLLSAQGQATAFRRRPTP